MVDVMSSVARSALMSRIRSKHTKPELTLRKLLWGRGYRFALHAERLAGRPDLVLPKWRAVIFVHGCFWHRHQDCSHFRLPKTRTEFWDSKLHANQVRDRAAIDSLNEKDWRVLVVWECALRLDPERTADEVISWLTQRQSTAEVRERQRHVVTERLSLLVF